MAQDETSTNQPEAQGIAVRPKPRNVGFPGQGRDDEYRYELKRQLEDGKIPPILIQSARLVGEGESADADKVIQYVRRLMEKLAQASTGKPSPDLKIFLCDQEGINTGV